MPKKKTQLTKEEQRKLIWLLNPDHLSDYPMSKWDEDEIELLYKRLDESVVLSMSEIKTLSKLEQIPKVKTLSVYKEPLIPWSYSFTLTGIPSEPVIVIGTKESTEKQVADTLRHEISHIGAKTFEPTRSKYQEALGELETYEWEKEHLEPEYWHKRIAPSRKKQLKTRTRHLTKKQLKRLEPTIIRVLGKRRK